MALEPVRRKYFFVEPCSVHWQVVESFLEIEIQLDNPASTEPLAHKALASLFVLSEAQRTNDIGEPTVMGLALCRGGNPDVGGMDVDADVHRMVGQHSRDHVLHALEMRHGYLRQRHQCRQHQSEVVGNCLSELFS